MIGTKSITDGSLLELSTTKIYKIVKFVRDHLEKAQLWQMGNLWGSVADMLIPS